MKLKFDFDTKKLEKELNEQMQKFIEKEQYKSDVENQKEEYGMVILQSKEEDALKAILDHYDGNEENYVTAEDSWFPKYMQYSIQKSLKKLEVYGMLGDYIPFCGGRYSMHLTPDGINYFKDKEKYLKKEKGMFNKLPSNSRKLLKEILESEDYVELLDKKFEHCNLKEDEELRGIIGELSDNGLINVGWADNVPYYVTLNNSARTYFEREKEYNEMQKKSNGTTINIQNLTAPGSNIVMGDVTNSTLSIDESIHELEKEIDEKGGEDKEELKELLEEVKDLLDNMKDTRTIPKNRGLLKRITDNIEKNGSFYGKVVTLIGKAALTMLGK